ncbi:hypothetical protein RD792_017508 [Penstemon davidsonii]|uniref:RRM domain-containing protein n=1 Tax=Penstemon davidsonii TaxID=160366 RepID=A0ABR0CNC5_9LAMI|nr:hypothetical protein RD792_017508 [Penstemon davidsonii]
MDSDQGKLFIGGISWETDEEKLKEYFQGYGEVAQTVVMRDKISGKPRGFGFVVFADPDVLDRVLQDRHVIDGRTVEAKRALSREEQVSKPANAGGGGARNFGGSGNTRTKKIFVGGLPPTVSEDGFRQYFEAYGVVTDVVIMYDQQTNRPRGFGFISFDSEDAVERVLHKTFHDLNGKQVEVKRALPKDSNLGGGGRSVGGNSGGYQGYGSSVGNSGSYDNRMESNRYMQSQNAAAAGGGGGGGYPSYGSSGYNPSGYGMGFNYGNFAGATPAGYGNPNAPNTGYGGVPSNAPRGSWGSQAPIGYGAATGQSPSGASGYGNQGYGYGGYAGNDGAYGNQAAAYGAVGGRAGSGPNGNAQGDLQAGAGGYMPSGYGDGWRTDPSQTSHGGQVGYGGGYGGGATRQAQQ